MSFSDFEARFGTIQVDEDTRFCIDYLERFGMRFLIEFGYENAKDRAVNLAIRRLRGDYSLTI